MIQVGIDSYEREESKKDYGKESESYNVSHITLLIALLNRLQLLRIGYRCTGDD